MGAAMLSILPAVLLPTPEFQSAWSERGSEKQSNESIDGFERWRSLGLNFRTCFEITTSYFRWNSNDEEPVAIQY
jgi:hypothetical protein